MKPTLSQLRRLVGNPDVYALQKPDGSWTPVRQLLTDDVLQSHLNEKQTVGTYIGHSPDGMGALSRTLVFDIDEPEDLWAKKNRDSIVSALMELGFPPSGIAREFSGKKGWHVWLVLQDYQPNSELRRVGRHILAMAGVQCEVFPKQDDVRDLGNLVKLPGGVHRVSGKTNDFIDPAPRPLPTALWRDVLATLPPEVKARRSVSETRFPCMDAIQSEGATEGGRHIQLFHLATMLRRAGVSDDNVELVVRKTNELCQPEPLDEAEMAQLLDHSKTSGPLCGQLPEDRHCGELCIRERTAGLYTRPGQLRYAAEGENVVVTLTGRKGDVVMFEHDDVGKMKAVLRGR